MIDQMQQGAAKYAAGVGMPLRGGFLGDQIVSELNPRYFEQCYQGNVFFAANQAAVTFSVGLTTTTVVGLVVSNPIGSNKLVVPIQVEFVNTGVIVGVAGLSVSPYSATNVTHTTALTVRNAYLSSGPSSAAFADSGATLPAAAVAWKFLYSILTTNTAVIAPPAILDLGGSLILPPGTAAAVTASTAITGLASMTWMELPIS